jgi:CubicO group peptidase (beta-lactamase class C family)
MLSRRTSFSTGLLLLTILLPLPILGQGLPQGDARTANFAPDRLTRLDGFLKNEIEQKRMPGAVAVIARDGKVIHSVAMGYQDIATQTPLTTETIFRFRSMTKPVIGVAAMILVEEGKLKLSDPVTKYIPSFANLKVYVSGEGDNLVVEPINRTMTVHHLLTHTAGFTSPGFGNTGLHRYLQKVAKSPRDFSTLDAFVAHQSKLPLLFHPGDRYEYSPSFDTMGYIIEVVSGQSLGEFLSQRIFRPLGMVDTAFYVPANKISRFASTYVMTKDGLQVIETGRGSVMLNPALPPSGGGGLVSTAADYLRFAQMLLNQGVFDGARILAPTTVKVMAMNHLPINDKRMVVGEGYGIGLGLDVDVARKGVIGNNGSFYWSGSQRTHFWVDPQTQVIGLFLTQVSPFDFEYDKSMRNLTYQALLNKIVRGR